MILYPNHAQFITIFNKEKNKITKTLLYETQNQFYDRYFHGKNTKNRPITPTKGLLHYYRRFQDLSINESNQILYYIQETNWSKICLRLSLFLTEFHKAHTRKIS